MRQNSHEAFNGTHKYGQYNIGNTILNQIEQNFTNYRKVKIQRTINNKSNYCLEIFND
jgi:hypothetical protein